MRQRECRAKVSQASITDGRRVSSSPTLDGRARTGFPRGRVGIPGTATLLAAVWLHCGQDTASPPHPPELRRHHVQEKSLAWLPNKIHILPGAHLI